MSRAVTFWPALPFPQALTKCEWRIPTAGSLIHPRRERAFRSRDSFGKRDGRVVARQNEEAAQEIIDADLLARLREHARAARLRVALPRGPGRDGHPGRKAEPALRDLAKDDLGGEDFRGGFGRHRRVGALFEQDRTGAGVDRSVGDFSLEGRGLSGERPGEEEQRRRRREPEDRATNPGRP